MDLSEVKHLPKVDHTPAELDLNSRILLLAAELIEEHGWVQGRIGDDSGGICVANAMVRAQSKLDPNEVRIYHPAYQRLCGSIGCGASIWNDKRGRTKDEVVAKLRAVALGG